jgi:hypothetical protein
MLVAPPQDDSRSEEDQLGTLLRAYGLPDRGEVQALLVRLDELSASLDQVLARSRPTSGPWHGE